MKKVFNRMEKVINIDKQHNYDNLKNVLKNDLFYLLDNYFSIDFDNIELDIRIDKSGKHILCMSSEVDKIKMPKMML